MSMKEVYKKIIKLAEKGKVEEALCCLNLTKKKIENLIKDKQFIAERENFDIVIDFKAKERQLNLYLSDKKWSEKLLKSVQKSHNFKSMMILIGSIKVFGKNCELRVGVFGVPTSELMKAILS